MEGINSKLQSLGLEPVNTKSVLYYYAPMKGCASFCVLGSQMMSPELYENFSFLYIPRVITLTNACLGTSLVGCSLYMYNRNHMKHLPPSHRLAYSAFGSTVFNLGCVLSLALCRSVMEQAGEGAPSTGGVLLRAVLGAVGTAGALTLARSYLTHVDVATKRK